MGVVGFLLADKLPGDNVVKLTELIMLTEEQPVPVAVIVYVPACVIPGKGSCDPLPTTADPLALPSLYNW